ncbi:hypothetical protein XarbCFBP8132_06175 [Xanthomonas arboricola]|nr:hypothetical protein XarbCFBP8132_06175 [Xanthomonas arboricola]
MLPRPDSDLERPTEPLKRRSDSGNVSATLAFVRGWSDVVLAVTLLDRKKPIRPHLVGRLRCMRCMHRLPLLATVRTDHRDWSLPAHRRGTLRGMDAA